MAYMCNENTWPHDGLNSDCSSWVDGIIELTCQGAANVLNVCIDLFDYDLDIDMDLRDFAFYQNNFGDLGPL